MTWVLGNAPKPLALKSANGRLNIVAVGNTVAGVNYLEHGMHLIYMSRDHHVSGVLLEEDLIPRQSSQVEGNDVYIENREGRMKGNGSDC